MFTSPASILKQDFSFWLLSQADIPWAQQAKSLGFVYAPVSLIAINISTLLGQRVRPPK